MVAGVRGQVGLIVVKKQNARPDIVAVIIPPQNAEARSVLETIKNLKRALRMSWVQLSPIRRLAIQVLTSKVSSTEKPITNARNGFVK